MATVGGGWLSKQQAEEGEEVVWSHAANRFQGNRAVGGKLFLTDRRLLFNPHRIDSLLRGRQMAIPLSDITAVGKEPKHSGKKGAFGGGLRDRLKVSTADGREELFVVNKLDEVISRLGDPTK